MDKVCVCVYVERGATERVTERENQKTRRGSDVHLAGIMGYSTSGRDDILKVEALDCLD